MHAYLNITYYGFNYEYTSIQNTSFWCTIDIKKVAYTNLLILYISFQNNCVFDMGNFFHHNM
jgi:hypothetical protein